MTQMEAIKLAIEWIEKQPEETPHTKYDVDTRYVVLRELEAALAQPDYKQAYLVWQEKTEWVQETAKPHELGMHRADVLKQRIDSVAQPEDKKCENCGEFGECCQDAQPEQEPVAIEYWLQDTMESGRWVKSEKMARATAERMLSGEFGAVFSQGRIVEPTLPPQRKEPEQAPVAYINIEERKLEWAYKYMSWDTPTVINLPKIPLYTEPPQRTWVDLTDDEMLMIYGQDHEGKKYNLGRMVQQSLKGKNT